MATPPWVHWSPLTNPTKGEYLEPFFQCLMMIKVPVYEKYSVLALLNLLFLIWLSYCCLFKFCSLSFLFYSLCVRACGRAFVCACVCVCDKHMLMEVRRLLRWVRECSLSTMSPQEWTPVIRFTKQSISTCLPISLALIYFVCLFACFGLGWDFLFFVLFEKGFYSIGWTGLVLIV